MEKYELAEQDYLDGMKYKDIAEKYEVTLNTVKSWKSRHWGKKVAPKEKSVHTKPKKVAHKVVDELVDNDDLTDKQKAFCLYYLQRFNATWAYMQAYGVNYATASAAGARMLANVSIQKQLADLKNDMANDLHLSALDIAHEYMKQAFADVGDYVEFGTDDVIVRDGWYKPVKDKLKGGWLTEQKSFVRLKNQEDVDTSMIKSVHIGRDGVVVELYDKQKALDALNKLLMQDSIIENDKDTVMLVDDIPMEDNKDGTNKTEN